MSSNYETSQMISVDEAIDMVLSFTKELESEATPMLEATGRVLAEDIVSDIDIAPFDNSAMDGFALKAVDSELASPDHPIELEVVGVIGAGSVFTGCLQAGEALRIMTGAELPAGADTVVMIEHVEVVGETATRPQGERIILSKSIELGKNVRYKGEEIAAGEVLMQAGVQLSPAGIGLLAATGNPVVQVIRRPRVAILATGDELVDPTQVPGPGKIRNSNGYSLAAAVAGAGGLPSVLGIVADDEAQIRAAVKAAVASHDMVLISGGAAGGDYDYTFQVLNELGRVYFRKVNMRPGKSQTLGVIDDTIVFGLAGNPVAALVGFEVLLRPALRLMQGYRSLKRPIIQARLVSDSHKTDSRRLYLRAHLAYDSANAEYQVILEEHQSSAILGAMQNANCLVILEEGQGGSHKDEFVNCLRLDIEDDLRVIS